jgi:hypothetical protein
MSHQDILPARVIITSNVLSRGKALLKRAMLRCGQLVWFEETVGSLIGRAEMRNVAESVASSFSCGDTCPCPPASSNAYLTPGSSVGPMGGTAQFSSMEQRQDCRGTVFGPYNRTSNSTWSSSNTSVFTVSVGLVSCLQPGSGTVTAQFQAAGYGQYCASIFITQRPGGPVQVYMPQLVGVFSPLVSGDSDSTISGQAFTLQIEARVPGSNPPQVFGNFNSPVTVTFPSLISGESISANPVTMTQGVGHATIVLKIVDSTPANTCCRSYTLGASGATPGAGIVKVWFSVIATKEGLFGSGTACGHTIVANDHFVALPATGTCNAGVMLRNGSNAATTTVLDVGPWFPHSSAMQGNPCVGPSDPYWSTTGVPRTETVSCDSNNAGIDLADGTFLDLGLMNPARILWRFN